MATFTPDTSNTLFQLAAGLVNHSGRNLFLTGKAGTGKTTFLKYIRDTCPKQMAIVAPTGVAAINAGGVTIHSFFQLPLSPFIPDTRGSGFSNSSQESNNRHNLISRLRYNREKRKLLQQLELLIIDEISMVRCDLLDAIDTILRHFRRRPDERFGGLQLLFIGDMYQLPPVIKEAEWQLFAGCYDSPYFFSSHVLRDELPLCIEFNKIYRQSEEKFIRLLNQVRNNEVDEDGLKLLESRYQPAFRRSRNDGYIILTTHNEQARNINMAALHNLEGPAREYEAQVADDFPPNAYPADELLYMKAGAQVMFIKNDTADRGKRYFNGKIGTVTRMEDEKIFVQCADDPHEIEVQREKWENIRYSVDAVSQQLHEQTLGTFTQFPLRLAWAITIHKSQGLTFDKLIIDAGEAFVPGQVYVALSRCTSLEGLILKSKIKTGSLLTDNRILQFSQNISNSAALQQELTTAKHKYLEKLVLSSFDFRLAQSQCAELINYLLENNSSFNPEAVLWAEKVSHLINTLQETAGKFQHWLKTQFSLPEPPEQNTLLQERTRKASGHFISEISKVITEIKQSPAITDSKLHAKEYNDTLKEVFAQLAATHHLLQVFDRGLDAQAWHQQKKSFSLPAFTVNAYAGADQKQTNSPHPLLHKQLREQRDAICTRKNLPVYLVLGTKSIDELARYLPQTLTEMAHISGFGHSRIKQYGQQFLDIITRYCNERNLESLIHEKTGDSDSPKAGITKKKRGDSHKETLRLYKEGKTITEIAKERQLAISTIEGHLCQFISSGDISIKGLVDEDKYMLIKNVSADSGGKAAEIKQKLPAEISFGEIKMVLASLDIMKTGNE